MHLADSVPAEERRAWLAAREELMERVRRRAGAQRLGWRAPEAGAQRENPFCACPHAQAPAGVNLTPAEREELKQLFSARIERYLASGYGSCILKDPEIQSFVRAVFEHDNGSLYALHVWCVMPNHIHVMVGGLTAGTSVRKIVGDWKRILAHRINRARGEKGVVWHEDMYTRIIRDADEYRNQVEYVWHNPESAGLASGFARECYVPLDFTCCA